MATREFNADYVYDLAVQALEGLKNFRDQKWREHVQQDLERQNEYIAERNKSLFRRLGWRKLIPLKTYEEHDAFMRVHGDWAWHNWNAHCRIYDPKLNIMTKLINLAQSNASAGRMMRLDEDDFSFITTYAGMTKS